VVGFALARSRGDRLDRRTEARATHHHRENQADRSRAGKGVQVVKRGTVKMCHRRWLRSRSQAQA